MIDTAFTFLKIKCWLGIKKKQKRVAQTRKKAVNEELCGYIFVISAVI